MQRKSAIACRLVLILIAPTAVAALPGCGKVEGTVTGKVTYNGTPLKGGHVIFQGEQSYSIPIGEDGKFTSPNMVAGAYKVCVETSSMKPRTAGQNSGSGKEKNAGTELDADTKVPTGYTPSNPKNAGSEKKDRYVFIPPRYENPESSDLSYTVTGGAQEFNIELK